MRRMRKKALDACVVVTELCPHCGDEIEMPWDVETLGYTASCPVCGGLLMLCGECRDCADYCDWDSETATCFRSRADRRTGSS